MNVLWVMRHAAYLRNFEAPIRALLDEGHAVHVGFTSPNSSAPQTLVLQLASEHPRLTFGPVPSRADRWVLPLTVARETRNYLRYLHPRYAQSPMLAARARRQLPARYARVLQALAEGRPGAVRMLASAFGATERIAPPSRAIEAVIAAKKADVVLVSSLVDYRCRQTDYVKSAKAASIPVGLTVASWDNLTNKGLINVEPDLVIVWNDVQRREAIELHGIAPARIAVTGAQLYDAWFERRPSCPRVEFCRRAGLDPDRPFVLYLCSSASISGGREPGFVRSWIAALRAASHPALRHVGVLVRQHPTNAREWDGCDLAEFGNAVIWPMGGRLAIDAEGKAGYFDTLWHSAAVVGINTSGLIEASILGRPVYTVTAPEFTAMQGGTLHFRYLLPDCGGPLRVAPDIAAHLHALGRGLADDSAGQPVRRWVEDFVRPHGLDRPATPFVVEAIRRLADGR